MFTKFNQVLLASGLVLTSLVGFGSSAFAAETASETQTLTGTVTADVTLTWVATPFTIDKTGNAAKSIGTVATTSNVLYKVTAYPSSLTSPGLLKHENDATDTITYTISLAGGTQSQNLVGKVIGDQATMYTSTGTEDLNAALTLAITGATDELTAGDYTDELVLSIAAQ